MTADVRDAFCSVPLSRLLDLVGHYLPDSGLVEFVGLLIGGARVPGLRRGGPLSPLLLNLYLHHHLDRKWRRRHSRIPLLRYADDILLMCHTLGEAGRAYDDLADLLQPTGMALKGDRADALRTLGPDRPAEWTGYRIEADGGTLSTGLADRTWSRLSEELELAHEKPDAPIHAVCSIQGRVNQWGPVYPFMDHEEAYDRVRQIARKQGFDEIPTRMEFQRDWQRGYARWCRLCQAESGRWCR